MINNKLIAITITGLFLLLNISTVKSNTKLNIETKEYGIYFKIPEGKIKNLALKMAQNNNSKITPHITVLQSVFTLKTVSKVRKILENWSKFQKKFIIKFKKKVEKGGGNNIFWNIKDPEKLHKINKELVDQIDPLRDGLLGQIKNNMENFSQEELINIKKYGRDFNIPGKNEPHITVVYENQDEIFIAETLKLLKYVKTEQEINEISFGEIDNNGNIIKTLYTYKFGL